MIKRETKRNILDHFEMEGIHFSGRMNDIDFLGRLFDLNKMPSTDPRYENASGDIWQHSINNNDYERNWVFQDERFQLLDGQENIFLRFVCEMAHPLVRPDPKEVSRIFTIANDWLKGDGWEIYPIQKIASGSVCSFRQVGKNQLQAPTEDELSHIWTQGKLRFFISHRDKHKLGAKKIGTELETYGISCFVAHESIQPMSTWKHEIFKALQTMEACLCYITSDFYDSEWTNQEVGFALAKGIPIYLYSVDKTDPRGFKLDTQAIKTGFPDLISCIKADFSGSSIFKNMFIQNFVDAINGSYEWAKSRFFDLVGLDFNDDEIDKIVEAFSAKAKYINQLGAILYDPLKEEHKKHPRLKNYTHYRDYLNNDVLSQHSIKRYSVVEDADNRFSIGQNIPIPENH